MKAIIGERYKMDLSNKTFTVKGFGILILGADYEGDVNGVIMEEDCTGTIMVRTRESFERVKEDGRHSFTLIEEYE